MVSFFIFVIGNGSLLYLVIRIRSCREIHRRRISGRWLDWWRPRNWRTWSRWFSRVVQSPDSSHGSSDPSDRRPGSSFWSPRRRVWPPGCCVISGNRHCWLCSRAGLGIWSHTLVHPSLQQSPHGHKINQYSLIDRSWYWREKRTADPRQDGGVLSTRWHSPCWGSMGCRAVQYHRLMACWAVRIRRVIKLECWAVRWCLLAWRVVTSCWPVTYGPVNCRAVCWAVTGQVIPCWVVTGWAVNCWAFHLLWRTRHCCWAGDFNCSSSTWTGWAGEEITVIVLLSGDLATFWRQLYFMSGDVRWSGPFSTLSSSLMMMTGRRLSVGRCPRWRWLQGSAIAWRLAMMVSMRGRGRRTGVLRLGNAVGPWTTNRIHLSPGAGPTRRAWMGPLNLSSAVMSRIWCLGESWRLSAPCLLFRSPLHNLWRSDPSEAGRPTTEMLEAMDFGSQDLEGRVADFSTSVALDPELVAVFVRFDPWLLALLEGSWRISSGAWILTELSMVSRSWDFCAAAAALRRFSCSLALACACQASSSQSLQTLHG